MCLGVGEEAAVEGEEEGGSRSGAGREGHVFQFKLLGAGGGGGGEGRGKEGQGQDEMGGCVVCMCVCVWVSGRVFVGVTGEFCCFCLM
jgi:hypothetical protein